MNPVGAEGANLTSIPPRPRSTAPQIRLSALSMPPASALRHHPRHHSAPPLPPP